MKRRYTLRPSPAMSLVTAVVGLAILIVGSVAMARSPLRLFLLLWIPTCLFIVGYHLLNAFSEKGVPTEMLESDTEVDQSPPVRSVADRLRDLDDLRTRNLITDSEYQAKRQEILREV